MKLIELFQIVDTVHHILFQNQVVLEWKDTILSKFVVYQSTYVPRWIVSAKLRNVDSTIQFGKIWLLTGQLSSWLFVFWYWVVISYSLYEIRNRTHYNCLFINCGLVQTLVFRLCKPPFKFIHSFPLRVRIVIHDFIILISYSAQIKIIIIIIRFNLFVKKLLTFGTS